MQLLQVRICDPDRALHEGFQSVLTSEAQVLCRLRGRQQFLAWFARWLLSLCDAVDGSCTSPHPFQLQLLPLSRDQRASVA